MSQYIERLQEDCQQLGLESGPFAPPVYDYLGLHLLVKSISQDLEPAAPEIASADVSDLSTDFAQRALYLLKQGISFDTEFSDCCEEAEPKLIDNLEADAITDPHYKSPLVVIHDQRPVGVIKRFGIQSMYGLQDMPDLNLFAGCFHKITASSVDIKSLPKSTHAWHAPLESFEIQPVRHSIFPIPAIERINLRNPNAKTIGEVALGRSHESIVTSSFRAFRDAVPASRAIAAA